MTYELEQKLTEIYPWFATPCDCLDGWQWIIVEMLKEIDDAYFNLGRETEITIMQCKEKFGFLNLYYGILMDDDEHLMISDIVEKYEQISKHTCEICGAEGKMIRDEYWISVRCGDCL